MYFLVQRLSLQVFDFLAYGVSLSLRAPKSFWQHLEGLVLANWVARDRGACQLVVEVQEVGSGYSLWFDGVRQAVPGIPERICEYLERWLYFEIAQRCTSKVFVHAAALAFRGHVLLIPGVSCSGKSTLAAALLELEQGVEYLSDEYAIVGSDGAVTAFPCSLGLRRPGQAKWFRSAASLGWKPCLDGLPLGWVLSWPYHSSMRPRLVAGSAGQAALALLRNSMSPLEANPNRVLQALSRACQGVRFASGVRDDVRLSARRLLEFCEQRRPHERFHSSFAV